MGHLDDWITQARAVDDLAGRCLSTAQQCGQAGFGPAVEAFEQLLAAQQGLDAALAGEIAAHAPGSDGGGRAAALAAAAARIEGTQAMRAQLEVGINDLRAALDACYDLIEQAPPLSADPALVRGCAAWRSPGGVCSSPGLPLCRRPGKRARPRCSHSSFVPQSWRLCPGREPSRIRRPPPAHLQVLAHSHRLRWAYFPLGTTPGLPSLPPCPVTMDANMLLVQLSNAHKAADAQASEAARAAAEAAALARAREALPDLPPGIAIPEGWRPGDPIPQELMEAFFAGGAPPSAAAAAPAGQPQQQQQQQQQEAAKPPPLSPVQKGMPAPDFGLALNEDLEVEEEYSSEEYSDDD